MRSVFNAFHVSQLKKCLRVPEEQVPIKYIEIESNLTYEEKPIQILDTKERVTRNRLTKLYKILWSNHGENDATWEAEEYLHENYPQFYKDWLVTTNLGTRFS